MSAAATYGFDQVEVGRRLTRLRRALGMNQREMSEFLGCGAPSMNMYEKGDTLIPVPYAAKLSYVHSIPLDWLYLGKGTMLPQKLAVQIAELEKREAEGTLEPEPRIRRRLG